MLVDASPSGLVIWCWNLRDIYFSCYNDDSGGGIRNLMEAAFPELLSPYVPVLGGSKFFLAVTALSLWGYVIEAVAPSG